MKTLYIIDGYSLAYTSFFAGNYAGLTSPSGEPTSGTYIFTRTILNLLKKHDPDMVCVAMDGPAKTFRKELYEEYKSNRKGKMPEDLLAQLPRMKQILENLGIPIYYAPGYEADDVIGTIVEKAKDFSITICSKDKDLLQLLTTDNSVNVFDPYKNRRTYVEDFIVKYEIHPNQFVDYLSLVGDTSDNIPGVRGIGPKTAVELLKEWGSLDRIYRNNEFENYIPIAVTPKVCEKLLKQKEMCILSKKLATIRRDVPIEFDLEDTKRKEVNWDGLDPIFEELGFESLLPNGTIRFGNRELP